MLYSLTRLKAFQRVKQSVKFDSVDVFRAAVRKRLALVFELKVSYNRAIVFRDLLQIVRTMNYDEKILLEKSKTPSVVLN